MHYGVIGNQSHSARVVLTLELGWIVKLGRLAMRVTHQIGLDFDVFLGSNFAVVDIRQRLGDLVGGTKSIIGYKGERVSVMSASTIRASARLSLSRRMSESGNMFSVPI